MSYAQGKSILVTISTIVGSSSTMRNFGLLSCNIRKALQFGGMGLNFSFRLREFVRQLRMDLYPIVDRKERQVRCERRVQRRPGRDEKNGLAWNATCGHDAFSEGSTDARKDIPCRRTRARHLPIESARAGPDCETGSRTPSHIQN